MDLDDMLKQHQSLLDKAHKSLTSAKGRDAPSPDLRQKRVDAIKAQMADLERQKQRAVARYDKAMAELAEELAHHAAAAPAPDAKPAKPAAKKPAQGKPAAGKGKSKK
jgi:hypothetical protein